MSASGSAEHNEIAAPSLITTG